MTHRGPMLRCPPGSSLAGIRPEQIAARCHALGLPGLVWLDSTVADADAQSLVAACPEEIIAGQPLDWPKLEASLQEFRAAHPHGAVVGWVEYEGQFRFGFYPRPLLFDHGKARWHQPGGTPEWLDSSADWTSDYPAWTDRLRFVSETTAREFCQKVEAAQQHIAVGDIYQVNLAHRLNASWPETGDAFALYLKLREVSPAPQSAFLKLDDDRTILCSSPEEFLVFQGREVRTRPIKGTRPRGGSPQADLAAENDLVGDEKERAELLMITDLLRNDLGQFCEYGSVQVRELFEVERFAQVIHLVSTIDGRLRAGVTHAAALRMCLPGGSITGAPKRRARGVIAELEARPREIYTGSIGVFLGGEQSRFNIAIRTLVIEGNQAHFHVGAGIVADSFPLREWEETLHKAAGILRAASPNPLRSGPC